MRLAVESYVLREQFGDKQAFAMAKKAGFDSIDYSFYWTSEEKSMLEGDYVSYAKELKRELEHLGLTCSQAHAPFDLKIGEPWELSCKAYRNIVRSLEFASILGAKHVVVHALRLPEHDKALDINFKFYKSLEPYCKKYGIKIAIENLFINKMVNEKYIGVFSNPETMMELVKELNSPYFVICIDVGHAALAGTEPEDYIAKLDNGLLQALHIQDTDYVSDKHMIPYFGKLNWDNITKMLASIRYKDDLTLEIFGYLKRLDKELLFDGLCFAEKIGRYLIRKIEEYNNDVDGGDK